METNPATAEAALEEIPSNTNRHTHGQKLQRAPLLEVLTEALRQGVGLGGLRHRRLGDDALGSQVSEHALQRLQPHSPHAPLPPPLLAPERRDEIVVEIGELHSSPLEPPTEEAKQVAVAAHALRPVLQRRERRGVRIEVRAEQPGAVAAKNLSSCEVVVQHGFSFGGVNAARSSQPDYAASRNSRTASVTRCSDEASTSCPPQTRGLLVQFDLLVRAACERLSVARADYRFTRREVREATGLGNTQLKVHLARLVELEYVLVHRGKQGQGYVYELAYDGRGKDGGTFLPGLAPVGPVEQAATTTNSPGHAADFAGTRRGVDGAETPGGRSDESGGMPGDSADLRAGAAPARETSRTGAGEKSTGRGLGASKRR